MKKSKLRLDLSCDGAAPSVARYVTVVGPCYPLADVCRVLDSDETHVRAMVSADLIALDCAPHTLLFPVWQFPHGRLLPHLADSLAALPLARMGPEEASLWFTRPRRPLRGYCAAGWLQRGGDPAAVTALAAVTNKAWAAPAPDGLQLAPL
jgi:hypothetical protein